MATCGGALCLQGRAAAGDVQRPSSRIKMLGPAPLLRSLQLGGPKSVEHTLVLRLVRLHALVVGGARSGRYVAAHWRSCARRRWLALLPHTVAFEFEAVEVVTVFRKPGK